ncbi:hypothetical protein B0T16DRAFT_431533 [Cercophora newfieldiana]|uniref:RRM domain-containing protein n=1 Tax=Cercophora newfieldiana TaxID=92897 RepID=A0AA39XYL0_9PEZI|nr:hypothetical protein B0T16DRAFT_431533 [Cercophora newfieldiana]
MTGQSCGYGFVRFSDETEQKRALIEIQGVYCGNRPIRISTANPKTYSHQHRGKFGVPRVAQGVASHVGWGVPYQHNQSGSLNRMRPTNQFTDPNNTTIFVGGLPDYVAEHQLRFFFQSFGEIRHVKILIGQGCGFVRFVHRSAAEIAMSQMQGYLIGDSRVRLLWAKSKNNLRTPYRPAPRPSHTRSYSHDDIRQVFYPFTTGRTVME